MTVCAVCCFCGRVKNIERIIRYYIDQDYKGQSYLLLYNNSPQKKGAMQLSDIPLPDNKAIILVNNDIDLETDQPYTNTGDIFRDALKFVPKGTDVVCWFDSDDEFLPHHLSAGVEGMKKAKQLGCLAYKPYYSYFLYENKCRLLHNTLEPSIFVDFQYVKNEGFNQLACSYHQRWLNILIARKQLFVNPDGKPSLMYNWQEGHGNHKISGMGDTEHNFEAHRKWEGDFGDGILRPASSQEVEKYYTLAKATKLETT